jgi:hypothetical protein
MVENKLPIGELGKLRCIRPDQAVLKCLQIKGPASLEGISESLGLRPEEAENVQGNLNYLESLALIENTPGGVAQITAFGRMFATFFEVPEELKPEKQAGE